MKPEDAASRPDAGDAPPGRKIETDRELDGLAWDERGLVPVVAQNDRSGAVLMVAWADREALTRTLETGFMHYRSRSRDALWKKGETSGNVQEVTAMYADCDRDTVLALVRPAGPACHTGAPTCFGGAAPAEGILPELEAVIRARTGQPSEGSYTRRLLEDEDLRMKKLGEETAELITALLRDPARAPDEAADLVYHLLVALAGAGLEWRAVEDALRARRKS